MTRVVHCRRERYDVYVGRPGPWGNPFPLTSESRRWEVLEKYEAWLRAQPELAARAKMELRARSWGAGAPRGPATGTS